METRLKEVCDRLEKIVERLNYGVYSFLDKLSSRQLRQTSKRFNIPLEDLIALQKQVRGIRTLALLDQELDWVKKYRPSSAPIYQQEINRILEGLQ